MRTDASRYTLRRSGKFTTRTTGPNHCGTTDLLDVQFRLVAVCPASALDTRGFLFDQTAVQGWFTDNMQTTALSCELLAAHCARELYRLIRRENHGLAPISLSLTLSPAPYMAEIEYAWIAPEVPAVVETRPARSFQARAEQPLLGLVWGDLFA